MGVPGFVAWLYKNHKKSNFIFKDLIKTSAIDSIITEENKNETSNSKFNNLLNSSFFL